MSSENYLHLRGGLTRVPKPSFDADKGWMWTAQMAVSKTRYSRSERRDVIHTIYVSLQSFGWVAEQMKDLTLVAGDVLDVKGELDQLQYEKPDGTKEQKTRMTVLEFTQITRRGITPVPPPFLDDEDTEK